MGKVPRIFGDVIKEVDEVKLRDGVKVTANAPPEDLPNQTGTIIGEGNDGKHYELKYEQGKPVGVERCPYRTEQMIKDAETMERIRRARK